MQEIIIDEEFQRLFPMLDEQQFCNLENDILEHGCMNPLVLWNGILIDGHNRYNIVTKNNLPFNTISLEFNSRDEVIAWMIKVQIDRRNLTPMQLTYYRGMHYNIEKKMHGGDRKTEEFSRGHYDPLNGKTANKLSEQYRISPRTIKRDGQIADVIIAIGKESEEAKSSILLGETRISRKKLREMSSDSDEHIAKTASKIESGTFEEKQNAATTGSQDNTGVDTDDISATNPANNSAGKHPLTADIINEANALIDNIQTIKTADDSEKIKKAVRKHINALEVLYKRIL
jgi:hypothetical protein